MAKAIKLFSIFLVFTFLSYTSANTLVDPYICGQPVCNPGSKFKYSQYITYHYDYVVDVNSMFEGSSENRSTLHVETKLSVDFISECLGILKILSVQMKDQDESFTQEREQGFSEKLTESVLRFAFHNGIVTEVCPQEKEEDWTLNFKKGILSLFQNSMSRFDMDFDGMERDIHGVCKTTYQMQRQQNTSLQIMKTKNLSQCIDRYKYLSILQTVRYNFESKYQMWPVLQSESRCRIMIDHNVYSRVQCRERHLFEPFSGKQSGAMTTVFQDLTLSEEVNRTNDDILLEKDKELEAITIRSDLLHHHAPSERTPIGVLQSARDILKQICKLEEASSDSEENANSQNEDVEGGAMVTLWGEFVRACRGLQYAGLSQLHSRAHTICPQGRKHIIDALPYIASVGSVELIRDLIVKKMVDENIKLEWLNSIAMIPRPHKEQIVSMGGLLREFSADKYVILATSAMIHSYCKNNRKSLSECCQEAQNMNVIEIFQKNVLSVMQPNQERKLTRDEREKVIINMKALGNVGGFTDDFRDELMKIIEDPSVNLPIRINSVDAFRRTRCDETRDYFLQVFKGNHYNVEIRLAAYLQVMRCPTYVTIRKILGILRNEEINQVAAFVFSHLENLGKSKMPSKVEMQGLLSGNTIPKPKHTPDIRKFSQNFENGIFFDEYNAGGNYEANLIMSPESYIPRSLSLNLTLDLFGESINILELKTRMEGFEHYVEKIFGPEGYLSRSKINEKLKSVRLVRSADEANEMKKKVDDINYKDEGLEHRQPMLDFSMKVFGNEINYWNAEGDDEIMETISQINPLNQIKKALSGKEINYKKASLFLDTTYAIPTGCGLPMNMNLLGTNIVNLKMSGYLLNIDDFKNGNVDFEGKMNPSMALNIAASMSVNGGGYGGTGIKLNYRMHTTTALSANLKVRSNKFISLNVSLPHSKQEIFEAKSELLVLHGRKEIKQIGFTENKVENSICSWESLNEAIGMKLCAKYEFPNMTDVQNAPYFIMAGPAHYLLSLEKIDPTAKVYSFLYSWDKNITTNKILFSFNTPNSLTKRTFDTNIIYSEEYGTASVNFYSAKHFLTAHATYKNLTNLKSIECVLDTDGQKHFEVAASLTKKNQKNGAVYNPNFYVIVNSEKITELAGALEYVQKNGVSQYDVQLEFQTKKLASRLIGYVTWNGPSRGAKLRLDYKFIDEKKQTIRMFGLVTHRDHTVRKDFYGELEFDFSSYPHLNFFIDTKYMNTLNHATFNFNLSSSRDFKEENGTLQYAFGKHRSLNGYKLEHNLRINRPYLDFQYLYKEDEATRSLSTTVTYDKKKSADSMVGVWGRLYAPSERRLYLDGSLNVTLPRLEPFIMKANVYEKKKNEIDINAECMWFSGTDVSVAALYQDQSVPNLVSHRLKAIITSTKFEEIPLEIKYTQDNKIFNITVRANQGVDQYGTAIRYVTLSERSFMCYGQIEFKSKIYSVDILADLKNDTQISTELHLDQLRDIFFKYTKINKPHTKKLNIELNWDANRDPSQKLNVDVILLNRGLLNYGGSFLVLYPGRSINGEFDFLVKDWFWKWLVKVGWSPDDQILWEVQAFSEMGNQTVYALYSKFDTPFQGWNNTGLNIMWRYFDNLQEFNTNMTWDKEIVVFNIFTDYMLKTNEVYGEISALINSTIPTLPNIGAIAKHRHHWKKTADTLLSFEYNNERTMLINSSWRIDRSSTVTNISGCVVLKSQYQDFKSGLLVTNFMFNQKRDIQGLTRLQLDDKVYTVAVEGHSKRFTNSLLNINVTSPIPLYSLVKARFGFIDTDRHLVALIESPNITLGAEVIFKITSMKDFHLYGHLAIPVDFFQNVRARAKRNSEEIDFRLGFEKFEFGFNGIWHYNNKLDFQYLYKLYTPLEGFEENGFVLKNIYVNKVRLDSEISLKLSKHKFGIVVDINDNDKGLLKIIEEKYLGIKTKNLNQLIPDFSSNVLITLDTLYYDTITFKALLNKVDNDDGEIVTVDAILSLPAEKFFTLKDIFFLEDLSTMRNDLHLTTPYANFSEIKHTHAVEIIYGEKYNISGNLLIKNNNEWKDNIYRLSYEHDTGEEDDYSNYIAAIDVQTQLQLLRSLKGRVNIFADEFISKISADFESPSCQLKADGKMEVDESFFSINGALNLTSPYFQPYKVQLVFKREYTEVENVIVGGLKIIQGNQNNYVSGEVGWHPNSTDYLRFKGQCSLIPIIPPSDVNLQFGKASSEKHRILTVEARVGSKDMLYSLVAEQQNTITKFNVISPHRGFKNISFVGDVKNGETIAGTLRGDTVTYNVNGKITGKNPVELVASLHPIGDGEIYTIKLKSTSNHDKYSLIASLISKIQFTLFMNLQFDEKFKDFSMKLDSSNQHIEEIFIKSRIDLDGNGKIVHTIQGATPLEKLRKFSVNTDITLLEKAGAVSCNYNATQLSGDGNVKWSLLSENIYLKIVNHHIARSDKSVLDLSSYFTLLDPSDNKTNIGFHVNIDDAWMIGANASSFIIPNQKVDAIINVLLPKPNVDVHSMRINVNSDPKDSNKEFYLGYMTDLNQYSAAVYGNVKLPQDKLHFNTTLEKGIMSNMSRINGVFDLHMVKNRTFDVECHITSPLYVEEETLSVKGNYNNFIEDLYVLKGFVKSPSSVEISNVDIIYGGTAHTVGKFNSSTPFKNLPWLGGDVRISNKNFLQENVIELFWTNKSALLNSTHKIQENGDVSTQTGIITVEIPLNTKHVLFGDYDYESSSSRSKGNIKLFHNENQFVKGTYGKNTDKGERDLTRDTIDMSIENSYLPLGIHYVHQYDDKDDVDMKQASVYQINNSSNFNITGRIDIEAWQAGKQVKVMLMQNDRVLKLQNNYESKERDFYQCSKIEWTPEMWLEYDVLVQNKTVQEKESQEINFKIRYPERELGLTAFYDLQESLLDGTAILNWSLSDDNKTVKLQGRWENPDLVDKTQHDVLIVVSHPSFRKDVTFVASYISDISTTTNISAVLEYSNFENEKLIFNSMLKDNSNGPARDYRLEVACTHPASNLELDIKADLFLKYKFYYINNYYMYKKSLFGEKIRHNKLLLDLQGHLAQIEQTIDNDWYDFNGKWEAVYPEYIFVYTVNRTNGNDTGLYHISGKQKNIVIHVNKTDDISYHLIGKINDARSADMIGWRDFENIKTIDLSSYIRLNHSRLLTSKVVWRPEIYQKMKGSVIDTLRNVYSQTNEFLVTIKTIPMETHEALKNVWSDAKPRLTELLNDLNDIHIIKRDIDEFQLFLNESYEANDFYIKNIVEFGLNALNQLSIKEHLESFPDIVIEMWQLMGETGTSLRKSVLWIIETIKSSHTQLVDKINKILEADLMDQVSEIIEAGILKYDTVIKDINSSFIHYCETTFMNVTRQMAVFWTNVLKAIEPTFIQITHYAETFVYNVGTEVLDFFYARTAEITETPFFIMLADFSHDIDKFVKDMKTNDAFTNIKKYTDKAVKFFNEKVIVHIPFQKELNNVRKEILGEINQLQQLSIVKYIKNKFYDAKSRLQWWYDYFKIGEAIKKTAFILYYKVTEIPRTAIENEEKHRMPKTNFIFDPRKGVILLEQKLPMPWHAFNRTPDITEIIEYKVVRDFVDNWFLSNTTLLSYYYAYKQYTDMYNLIPPYAGKTVITAQGSIVTFDRKVYSLNESGTFLLLSDFVKRDFSILIKFDSGRQYSLIILTNSDLVKIDVFNKNLNIGRKSISILPIQIDDWVIHRNEDFVTASNVHGLIIDCNFLYKTCTFSVEGWYFGRLGGLLGTMNNEPYDDMMTPDRRVTGFSDFINSWRIRSANTRVGSNPSANVETCENFFRMKVSSLKACFSNINPEPFYLECMEGLDPCTLANAYRELCQFDHIPIRLPNQCMECKLSSGVIVEEGTFSDLTLDVQNTTDIVFLVEMGECNKNLRKEKNLDTIINVLETKLNENGFRNNRYTIVGFGGDGIYKTSRSLYVNNKLFASVSEIPHFFDHIHIDDPKHRNKSYSADTFEAFKIASSLNFRPGVSKTFILFPCTKCDISYMMLDYTIIHQVLMDSSITLHIVMNDDFKMAKRRVSKNLYGIDNSLAFTSKDLKELMGDAKLRKQIKVPKSNLGYCASLAIETNGSIFSGKKMKNSESGGGRKAASVFGARIAQSIKPCLQPRCECDMTRLKCGICPRYLTRTPIDDISLSILESSELDTYIDNYLDMPIIEP